MTTRHWISLTVLASLAGLLVALLVSDDQQVISAKLWLGVTLALIAATVASVLLATWPTRRHRPLPLVRRARNDDAPELPPRPRDLLTYDRAVTVSVGSAAAFNTQLRPRLSSLVAHRLRSAHDLNDPLERDRVAALLGPTAWMVDSSITDRAPTTDELQEFATRLTGDIHG